MGPVSAEPQKICGRNTSEKIATLAPRPTRLSPNYPQAGLHSFLLSIGRTSLRIAVLLIQGSRRSATIAATRAGPAGVLALELTGVPVWRGSNRTGFD
jgi:hypothetical protein